MRIHAREAPMRIGTRWMLLAAFAAFLFVSVTLTVRAQQPAYVRGEPDTRAQRLAPEDRDAAARAEADRLEGLGGEPEALLGAPATSGDPYGAAFDATRRNERALTHTERVPRGALANQGDGPRPAIVPLETRPGTHTEAPAANAKVDQADPGAHSPTESALSIYRGSGDVGKAMGQIYRMPW